MVKPVHIAVGIAVIIGGVGIVVAGQTGGPAEQAKTPAATELRFERCDDTQKGSCNQSLQTASASDKSKARSQKASVKPADQRPTLKKTKVTGGKSHDMLKRKPRKGEPMESGIYRGAIGTNEEAEPDVPQIEAE